MGEGIPDVICLKRMAQLFGVSIDYFLEPEHSDAQEVSTAEAPEKPAKYVINHFSITAISLLGVAVAAALVYLILKTNEINTLLPFAAALPIGGLLGIIFNALWGKKWVNFPLITLFTASILFLITYILKNWEIILFAIPAAIIIWLACRVRRRVE